MSYFEKRLFRLLSEGKVDAYFLALKQSNKISSLVFKKFLSLNQNIQDFLYENQIEEEVLYALWEGQFIPCESTMRCLALLNISDENIQDCAIKSFESAKTKFEKHKTELNLDLDFPITIEDFKFKPLHLEDIKSRKFSLDKNKEIINHVTTKFHEESSNEYVKEDNSMHENESVFWQNLRQRLHLSYKDIEHMSDGKFTVEQISALEHYLKPRDIEISLDREDYFNFLKGNLVKVDNLYEHLSVDFCEYKFYVEKLIIPLVDVETFGEPFKYFFKKYNVGNKKYLTTHCSFFIR